MTVLSPLLDVLTDVPDPHRTEGKLYKLPNVLLFSILAIVTGCNSYRGIATFIDVHRNKLNSVGLNWSRAPAHTAIRYILKGLDPSAVETAFRRHAARLQAACETAEKGSIALDGKTLRGSFDICQKKHFDVAAQANAPDRPVKDNQPTLHQQIQGTAQTATPLGCDKSHDRGRNRDETRIATVFDASDKLSDTEWHPHVKTIIQARPCSP